MLSDREQIILQELRRLMATETKLVEQLTATHQQMRLLLDDPTVAPVKTPNPEVKAFLIWFRAEYTARRHGADYTVAWAKHATLVKEMLKSVPYDRLQNCARILLSDKTDDSFIVQSDRGIEILRSKINWLSDRLAEYETRTGRADPSSRRTRANRDGSD